MVPSVVFSLTRWIARGAPQVPGVLGEEIDTNPFLRPFSKEIRTKLGVAEGAQDWEAFGAIRAAKDTF